MDNYGLGCCYFLRTSVHEAEAAKKQVICANSSVALEFARRVKSSAVTLYRKVHAYDVYEYGPSVYRSSSSFVFGEKLSPL